LGKHLKRDPDSKREAEGVKNRDGSYRQVPESRRPVLPAAERVRATTAVLARGVRRPPPIGGTWLWPEEGEDVGMIRKGFRKSGEKAHGWPCSRGKGARPGKSKTRAVASGSKAP